MNRLFFTLVFLGNAFSVTCQCFISGQVTNARNEPLEIFDVLLLAPGDSSLIAGNTYMQSSFRISLKCGSAPLLKISKLGYEDYFAALPSPVEGDAALGDIVMQEMIYQAQQVTVSAKRPPVFDFSGQDIKVKIKDSYLSNLTDMGTLLSKLPGVVFRNDSELQVLGKGQAIVLIDEQQTSIQELNRLNPAQIEEITIVKDPGPEYPANARAVIKIKTRIPGEHAPGWVLKSEIRKATFYSFFSSAATTFKLGATAFNLNVTANPSKHRENYWYERIFHQLDDTRLVNRLNADERLPHDYGASLKISRQLGRKQSLLSRVNYSYTKGIQGTDSNLDILENDQKTDSTFLRINKNQHTQIASLYLNYLYQVDSATAFKLLAGYSHYHQIAQEYVLERSELPFSTDFDNAIDIWSVEPRMEHYMPRIKVQSKLGMRYAHVSNKSIYGILESGADNFNSNHTFENKLDFYFTTSRNFGKLALEAGLRYEYLSAELLKVRTRTYRNIFPNFSANYPISGQLGANFSYSRRTTRPDYAELTTHVKYIDPYSFVRGNPLLEPEFTDVFSLGLNYKRTIALSGSYSKSDLPIVWYIQGYAPPSIASDLIQKNLNKSISLSGSLDFFHKYKAGYLQGSFGVISQHLTGDKTVQAVDIENFAWYFFFYNDWKVKKWFTLNITYQYISGGLFGIFALEPRQEFSTGISKKISSGLFAYLTWNDVFNTNIVRFNASAEGIEVNNRKFDDIQSIRLGITYRINTGKKNNITIEQSNEEELRRAAITEDE